MKITKIEVYRLFPRKVKPIQISDGVKDDDVITPVVCRIYTDEGIYGDGEAAMAYNVGADTVQHMTAEFARKIIGMDPLENEVIWNKIYRQSFWALNGGVVTTAAMSAIDNACWDIRGKYFGVPVYELLGGAMRTELRSYASQLQNGWSYRAGSALTPDDFAESARVAVAEGYDAIKVNFFTQAPSGKTYSDDERRGFPSPAFMNEIEARVKATRDAVGPNVDIIAECHAMTDPQSLIRFAERMEKYNLLALEEPCNPEPALYKYIASRISTPLAGGERVYTRAQFLPYLLDGSIRLLQPDIGPAGGITEIKKICDLADTFGVGVQIHTAGTPVEIAAALQVEAAIPNFTIHENLIWPLYEEYLELGKYPVEMANGKVYVPDRPGLGNELSDFALSHADILTVTE